MSESRSSSRASRHPHSTSQSVDSSSRERVPKGDRKLARKASLPEEARGVVVKSTPRSIEPVLPKPPPAEESSKSEVQVSHSGEGPELGPEPPVSKRDAKKSKHQKAQKAFEIEFDPDSIPAPTFSEDGSPKESPSTEEAAFERQQSRVSIDSKVEFQSPNPIGDEMGVLQEHSIATETLSESDAASRNFPNKPQVC